MPNVIPTVKTPVSRQYIGARYIPVFAGNWDNSKDYAPLTVVYYQGASYTSRTYIPSGIDITNTTYWALSADYNAQVAFYREEVLHFEEEFKEAFVTPQMYGAAADNTTDDTAAFQNAIDANDCVYVPSGNYRLESPITVPSNKIILGNLDSILYFPSGNGIEITGRNVIIDGLNVQGERDGIGITLGNGSDSYTKNRLSNLIIGRFETGIKNLSNIFSSSFDNIRVDYCTQIGIKIDSILSESLNYKRNFSVTFSNVYCNQCEADMSLEYTYASFVGCNFSFLHPDTIEISKDSNISFTDSNFECDAALDTGTMINVSDSSVIFEGCSFLPNSDAGLTVFTLTDVNDVVFSNCNYVDNSTCVLFDSTITANKYGAIKFVNNNTMPTMYLTGEAHSYLHYIEANKNIEYFDKAALTLSKLSTGTLLTHISDDYRPIGFSFYNGAVIRENEQIVTKILNVQSAINAQGNKSVATYYIDADYTGTLPDAAYKNGTVIISKQDTDAVAILFPDTVTLPPISMSLVGGNFSSWTPLNSNSILKSTQPSEQTQRIGSLGIGNDGTDFLSVRGGDGSLIGKIRFDS